MGSAGSKVVYIGSALLLGAMALYSSLRNQYFELSSRKKVMLEYLWLMILIAIVVGAFYFIVFKKIFPKGYERQNAFGKAFIPIVFVILAYAVTRGMALYINCSFVDRSLMIEGRVLKKYKEKKSKRSTSFYMNVLDTAINQEYNFETSGNVFRTGEKVSEMFIKEFRVGCLGIMFRKEQ